MKDSIDLPENVHSIAEPQKFGHMRPGRAERLIAQRDIAAPFYRNFGHRSCSFNLSVNLHAVLPHALSICECLYAPSFFFGSTNFREATRIGRLISSYCVRIVFRKGLSVRLAIGGDENHKGAAGKQTLAPGEFAQRGPSAPLRWLACH